MKLGLSPEQVIERRKRIHAGDAAAIMEGRWRELFLRKTGRAEEEDLSDEFRVQLGSFTEPFNLAWTEKMTGRAIEYYSANPLMQHIWYELTGRSAVEEELLVTEEYPWMACNLDGFTKTPQGAPCPIDAKHVGTFSEQTLLRYTPAGVHQATVTGCDWWALSVIAGNKWLPPIYQPVDPFYQASLIAKEREFWGYVERDEEPEDRLEPTLAPKPMPQLRKLIVPVEPDVVYQAMCRKENWLPEAIKHIRAIIDTDGAAKVWAINREAMKELVPEDVGTLEWGRFTLKRDRRGVTMTVQPMEKDDG